MEQQINSRNLEKVYVSKVVFLQNSLKRFFGSVLRSITFCRSSHVEVFFIIFTLKNFAILKEKHLNGVSSVKLQSKASNVTKKTLLQVFSCQFYKMFKNTFFRLRPGDCFSI